jgi:hypothetical protein
MFAAAAPAAFYRAGQAHDHHVDRRVGRRPSPESPVSVRFIRLLPSTNFANGAKARAAAADATVKQADAEARVKENSAATVHATAHDYRAVLHWLTPVHLIGLPSSHTRVSHVPATPVFPPVRCAAAASDAEKAPPTSQLNSSSGSNWVHKRCRSIPWSRVQSDWQQKLFEQEQRLKEQERAMALLQQQIASIGIYKISRESSVREVARARRPCV